MDSKSNEKLASLKTDTSADASGKTPSTADAVGRAPDASAMKAATGPIGGAAPAADFKPATAEDRAKPQVDALDAEKADREKEARDAEDKRASESADKAKADLDAKKADEEKAEAERLEGATPANAANPAANLADKADPEKAALVDAQRIRPASDPEHDQKHADQTQANLAYEGSLSNVDAKPDPAHPETFDSFERSGALPRVALPHEETDPLAQPQVPVNGVVQPNVDPTSDVRMIPAPR